MRLTLLNAENLFLRLDRAPSMRVEEYSDKTWAELSRFSQDNKPLSKLIDLARFIEKLQPDILMLCEVGGRESLENFNRYFLNEKYNTFLERGNSERGIDVGYLCHKRLQKKYELISHRDRLLDFHYPHEKEGSHRFSRDLAELRVYKSSASGDQLEFVLLLLHLKSKLDPRGIDHGGRLRRQAEFNKALDIYSEIRAQIDESNPLKMANELDRPQTSLGVPIFLCGDFNAEAFPPYRAPELARMEEMPFIDVLEVAQVPRDQRTTQVHVDQGLSNIYRQIDFICIEEFHQHLVDPRGTYIHRYEDQWGIPISLPQTESQKHLLPSDHYPVVLNLQGLD